MGPYDQNENLHLSVQLPDSNLDFEAYTEFKHDNNLACKKFQIRSDNDQYDILHRLDALEIVNADCDSDNDSDEDEDKLMYTCDKKLCSIPCPCCPCCTGSAQCNEHWLMHPDLFDEKVHAIGIRSTEEFCVDQTFFTKSCIIKYSGIPIQCFPCSQDLLDHNIYHIDFHDKCKFCRHKVYKQFQETTEQLLASEKRHKEYLKSVCPYCDSKFCDPYFKSKHVEFQHEGEAPFKCDYCETRFHAKQSKQYHENVHHTNVEQSEKCGKCDKTFSARVSLRNHEKYAHSEVRLYSCTECDAKFKQKKNERAHYSNIHGFSLHKEMYGRPLEQQRHHCKLCSADYKYKTDLNAHIKLKHEEGKKSNVCDLCPAKFQETKSLNAHKKMKHGNNENFACPECGKGFNQKNNLKRHQLIHNKCD